MFSKKKNEVKKANKSQINQIFIRKIKSYQKRTPCWLILFLVINCCLLTFLVVYKVITVPIFFLFLFFFFFILDKITSCKNKMSSSSHCTKNEVFHYEFLHFLCSVRVKKASKFRFDVL